MYAFMIAGMLILVIYAFASFSNAANKALSSPGNPRKGLDRASMIINILLLILYIPLSLLGSLSGMVSDGHFNATPVQSYMCDLITIVGICTPAVAYGGLFVSMKLRRAGHSLQSFLWQFCGIGWMGLILVLIVVLEAL